jgi:aldose 1-epimerase
VLHLPVDTWLPTGAQQIPTGQVSVAGSPYDFREPRAIGDLALDVAFTGLARDPDGRFRLRLSGERTVTLWLDEAYPYVEVFSGDTLAPARRRQGLGVEPMSAPPNALVTGEGLVLVDPGEAWQGSWGIEAG